MPMVTVRPSEWALSRRGVMASFAPQVRMEFHHSPCPALFRSLRRKGILGYPDICLGSYVLKWGNKQEGTAAWHGMFLEDGTRLEAIRFLYPANSSHTLLTPTAAVGRNRSSHPLHPVSLIGCSIQYRSSLSVAQTSLSANWQAGMPAPLLGYGRQVALRLRLSIHHPTFRQPPQGRYSITFFTWLPFRAAIPVACRMSFPSSPSIQTTW